MPGSTPLLFKCLEQLQSELPWGHFLDAGTGPDSARWITTLATQSWTAVTASREMARQTVDATRDRARKQDRIIVANWLDPELLSGKGFDTVLLDYFIGAIESYAPYFQEQALHRLRPLIKQRLYVIGVDPYVSRLASDETGQIVREIGCLRDACLLLAGERPYREFPMEWVVDQLSKANFQVLSARRFSNVYREHFVHAQLDLSLSMLEQLPATELRKALNKHIEQLRVRALALARAGDGLKCGADYVISARPI
jgi:hypothetical protein